MKSDLLLRLQKAFCPRLTRCTPTSMKRDPRKRPTKRTTKEINERDPQKRPTKETCQKELLKGHTQSPEKERYTRHICI